MLNYDLLGKRADTYELPFLELFFRGERECYKNSRACVHSRFNTSVAHLFDLTRLKCLSYCCSHQIYYSTENLSKHTVYYRTQVSFRYLWVSSINNDIIHSWLKCAPLLDFFFFIFCDCYMLEFTFIFCTFFVSPYPIIITRYLNLQHVVSGCFLEEWTTSQGLIYTFLRAVLNKITMCRMQYWGFGLKHTDSATKLNFLLL